MFQTPFGEKKSKIFPILGKSWPQRRAGACDAYLPGRYASWTEFNYRKAADFCSDRVYSDDEEIRFLIDKVQRKSDNDDVEREKDEKFLQFLDNFNLL